MRTSLGEVDRHRIRLFASFVRTRKTDSLLTLLTPRLGPAERTAVTLSCRFTHAGLLIFPADAAGALAELPALGVLPGPLVPSVVVRSRLAQRYSLPAEPTVWITHATAIGSPRELELFLVCGDDEVIAEIAQEERTFNRESHFALDGTGSPEAMSGVWEILVSAGELLPDGGGYNPHENPAGGGRTVLYFRGTEQGVSPWPPRMELVIDGHHADLLARHRRSAGVML
jgi:hypothetical protein